jgi:hypothetical protein
VQVSRAVGTDGEAMHIRTAAVAAIALGAGVALVIGVLSGLARLGVEVPEAGRVAGLSHGALMVAAFAGTVIGLERAVATGHGWAYAGPAASSAGGAAVIAGFGQAGVLLFLTSALVLALMMVRFWRLQPAPPMLVIAVGALCWAGASIRWLSGGTAAEVVPWWLAFLALTLAGERLELTRFRRQPLAPLVAAGCLLALGLIVSIVALDTGARIVGVALAGIGTWLVWTDTARLTMGRGGLATYTGAALLAAYVTLLASGLWLALHALHPGSAGYDSAVHLFFVGFVMGAILAHGPIIVPALTGRSVRLTWFAPVALVTLHGSLVMRVVANGAGEHAWRQTAGMLHAVALMLFVAAMLVGLWLARREPHGRRSA